MLIIGRAIAGLGCSGLMNGCLTLIFGAITPEKRTRKFQILSRGQNLSNAMVTSLYQHCHGRYVNNVQTAHHSEGRFVTILQWARLALFSAHSLGAFSLSMRAGVGVSKPIAADQECVAN